MRGKEEGHVFFFSSRRRHTRFDCDWSSDVCSSDLRSSPAHPARAKARSRSTRSTLKANGATSNRFRRTPSNSSNGCRSRSSTQWRRSEEHTSELQSQSNLVCRLLLEKKKTNTFPVVHQPTYHEMICREGVPQESCSV